MIEWAEAVWHEKFARHLYTRQAVGIEPQAFYPLGHMLLNDILFQEYLTCSVDLCLCTWLHGYSLLKTSLIFRKLLPAQRIIKACTGECDECYSYYRYSLPAGKREKHCSICDDRYHRWQQTGRNPTSGSWFKHRL